MSSQSYRMTKPSHRVARKADPELLILGLRRE
jgi:hypothetical protein